MRVSVIFALAASAAWCANDPRLVDAAKAGRQSEVESLLKAGASPDSTSADGTTALHWAVNRNDFAMTDKLLASGAQPSLVTRYSVVPLTLAAENGNAAMIERLLKAGASPDSVSEEGQTALMTASRNGNLDAVRVLLRSGAKVNLAENFRGQTALMFAAGEGNTAAAELLIEFGAGLQAKSKAGFTPLLFAVRNNHIDTVKFLLSKGANANDEIGRAHV